MLYFEVEQKKTCTLKGRSHTRCNIIEASDHVSEESQNVRRPTSRSRLTDFCTYRTYCARPFSLLDASVFCFC